jgi:hypothetical protein
MNISKKLSLEFNNFRFYITLPMFYFRSRKNILLFFDNIFWLFNLIFIFFYYILYNVHLIYCKFIYFFFSKKKNKNIIFNIILKNKLNRCFIIGSGPSLNKIDLKFLNKETTFVSNNFFRHKYCESYQPTFYCIFDGAAFYPNTEGSGKSEEVNKKKLNYIKNLSKNINNRISSSTFIFPTFAYQGVNKYNLYDNKKIQYVNLFPFLIEEYMPKKIDFFTGIPRSWNIVPYMICLALSLNYKEIILAGCDQTLYLNEDIFFQKRKNTTKDYVLSGKNYTKLITQNNKNDYVVNRLNNSCSNLVGIWSTYKLLLEHQQLLFYAKKNGQKIINTSEPSILDMYNFKNYKNILKN